MSIQTELNRINTTVSNQTSLLAQIQTALEGKAAGGGGSGGTELQCVTGTYTPSADTSSITIQHNLGVMPKVIYIAAVSKSYLVATLGSKSPGANYQCFISAMYALGNSHIARGDNYSSGMYVYNDTSTDVDITSVGTNQYGICGVTNTSLTISHNTAKLYAGVEYKYIVIG